MVRELFGGRQELGHRLRIQLSHDDVDGLDADAAHLRQLHRSNRPVIGQTLRQLPPKAQFSVELIEGRVETVFGPLLQHRCHCL